MPTSKLNIDLHVKPNVKGEGEGEGEVFREHFGFVLCTYLPWAVPELDRPHLNVGPPSHSASDG